MRTQYVCTLPTPRKLISRKPFLALLTFLCLSFGLAAQTITTTSPLPDGFVGEAYEGGAFQFQVDDAAFDNWSWEQVPGSLGPDINNTDLVLNADGTVSGAPSSADDNPNDYDIRVTVTDGATNVTKDFTLTISERRAADVVLVLDRSGSMGWSTNVTPPAATRWDALKNAVNSYMNKLADPAIRTNGDRVGLTYFHSGVLQPDATRFPTPLIPLDNAAPGTVSTELNSQSPGGATAMGPGLSDGLGKLSDPDHIQTVLLFTDGEQNVAPQVNSNGRQIGAADILSSYPAQPGTKQIFTVGIGSPAGLDHTTLLNLAGEHRGSYLITSNGNSFNSSGGTLIGNIDAVFNQAFIDMLHDYSPQNINFSSGELSTGNSVVTLAQFPVNEGVSGPMIELIFNRKFEIPSLIQLLSRFVVQKDGANVMQFAQPRFVGNYTNSVILSFNFASSGQSPQGMWTVQFAQSDQFYKGSYTMSVIVNDHSLDYTASSSPRIPSVGDDIGFDVNMSYGGDPITDATVRAIVFKPGDDLGDLLARNDLVVDVNSDPDAGSPGMQKYQSLLESDPNFVAQLLPDEQSITLSHQGNGQYTGTFGQVDLSGIYQILYIMEGTSPGGGTILRIHTESKYVTFGEIDAAQSVLSYTFDAGANVTTITMRPITVYGKFVGPANGNAITWDSEDSQLLDVQDNQDGSYTIRVQGAPSVKGSLSILGKPVFEGKISSVDCLGAGNIIQRIKCWLISLGLPGWLIWVILALILLLIGLLLRRRRP
ncbi:MAG: VWA domain-containing protein [Phaeodactylibacter sp.]|nr:VWA domain-containing protein [Phaeodactylibacter sp.]MCB9274933.1 VWA domain-containing protein [Lewinellaceae bacterium]